MAHVQVSVGEYFAEPADLVVSLDFDDSSDWNLGDCLQELESLVTLNGVLSDGHSLQVSLANTSWGFDGSAADVILYISNWLIDKVTEGAIGVGVGIVIDRMVKRLQPGKSPRIQRHDAIEAAQTSVVSTYPSETRASLSVIGESELADHDGWTIHLRSSSKSDYDVTVRGTRGSSVTQKWISRHAAL